ncbi:MAG: two-component system, OmpR family, sensor kinase [Verrucomicrobiota bacterium]
MAGFRTKLLAAMMLVVSGLTALGLYFAQRNVVANTGRDLQQKFQAELSWLRKVQELRHAALAERCNALASKPRIHAALEDNALDLLYPTAKDELGDLMEGEEATSTAAANSLHARFYRFLDSTGAVLSPPNTKDVGELDSAAERQLALNKLSEAQQTGYVRENVDPVNEIIDEVVAVPIFSTETGDVISALVVGFKPFELEAKPESAGMKSGIWVSGQLYLRSLRKPAQDALAGQIKDVVTNGGRAQNNFIVPINGTPHLLFYKRLNPNSLFPAAYETCLYPLAGRIAQLHRLRWQIGGAGVLLFLVGFVASNFVAARFSKPVEQLAVDSEKDRVQRKRAETALASTSEKLKRSTRYSADASHQLKSPVTILRIGLEALLAREDFKPEVYEELSSLIHQTHRLAGVIDDLLLLSRMEAGHVEIAAESVNLSQLIDEWLDDLSAVPDSIDVKINKDVPIELNIIGEKRYTSLIVQNLLENALKYNHPGGRIRVRAERNTNYVLLIIGNTGRPIPPDAQPHIFEQFRRGGTNSAISGHGLGLNLARQLARLHGGDIRLACSENDWTEFELRFPVAQPAPD